MKWAAKKNWTSEFLVLLILTAITLIVLLIFIPLLILHPFLKELFQKEEAIASIIAAVVGGTLAVAAGAFALWAAYITTSFQANEAKKSLLRRYVGWCAVSQGNLGKLKSENMNRRILLEHSERVDPNFDGRIATGQSAFNLDQWWHYHKPLIWHIDNEILDLLCLIPDELQKLNQNGIDKVIEIERCYSKIVESFLERNLNTTSAASNPAAISAIQNATNNMKIERRKIIDLYKELEEVYQTGMEKLSAHAKNKLNDIAYDVMSL